MNKRKHSNIKSNHSSSTTTIVHIVISLLVIYIYHYYYSIFFTIRENKRLDQALFKVSMFFFLASTFTYMLIIYELVKDKKALFYFNVYKLLPIYILFTISGIVLFIFSFRYLKEYSIFDRALMVVLYIIIQVVAIADIDNIQLNTVHMIIQTCVFLIGVFIKQKGFVYL